MLVIDVDYIESDFYCKINAFVRLMQISWRVAAKTATLINSMNLAFIILILFSKCKPYTQVQIEIQGFFFINRLNICAVIEIVADAGFNKYAH